MIRQDSQTRGPPFASAPERETLFTFIWRLAAAFVNCFVDTLPTPFISEKPVYATERNRFQKLI
jgi:hypothetical protein